MSQSTTQLKLGDFAFSVSTASFGELQRTTEYRWASQQRLGQLDALQFAGPGSDIITINGVVFPHYAGGLGQIQLMREFAAAGVPLLLVDGMGNVHGRWVIESVEETQGAFLPGGVPRRQAWVFKLRKYNDG